MKLKTKYEGLLAIDPGVKTVGWCVFNEGRYIGSGLARPYNNLTTLSAMEESIKIIHEKWEEFLSGTIRPEVLVIERPQVYQQQFLKGDPNDLIPLAIIGGAIWNNMKPKEVVFPQPKQWKGQVPKDVMTERTIKQLTKQEQELLKDDVTRIPSSLRHNVYDAIGIALWQVNRKGARNE